MAVNGTQHTKKMMSVAARFAAQMEKQHAGCYLQICQVKIVRCECSMIVQHTIPLFSLVINERNDGVVA